jgi:hypothetical protein
MAPSLCSGQRKNEHGWYAFNSGHQLHNDILAVCVLGEHSQYRDGLWCGVRFPVEARYFSLFHSVQNGSVAHSVSYTMDTGGSVRGDEKVGA